MLSFTFITDVRVLLDLAAFQNQAYAVNIMRMLYNLFQGTKELR